ncbi:MAG: FKBP-type peptidyl-prolyl cis-trans isomerase [Deltaproteobacteria bacterium]|nr:FKBP-type peptidyl-prolyl cis-trans isomerase [Deltaproteobacteria bacterium]
MSSARLTHILLGASATLAAVALFAALLSPPPEELPAPTDLREAPQRMVLQDAPATPTRIPADRFQTGENGLGVFDLRVGEGPEPGPGDSVKLRWRTWTADDRLVEDGTDRPARAVFLGAARNLEALNLGVPGMREGGLRQLKVPAALGYGQTGSSRLGVTGGTDLVIEVELLQVLGQRVVPEAPAKVSYQTLPSGLQVAELSEGTGPTPQLGDTVVVDYTGWLDADGALFDSSLRRPEPATFKVGAVIEGWNEALTTMQVGGHRQLRVPADLAYGEAGRPPQIPPGATLIFDLKLMDRR